MRERERETERERERERKREEREREKVCNLQLQHWPVHSAEKLPFSLYMVSKRETDRKE